MADDRGNEHRAPIGLRLRLRCASLADFEGEYAGNISRGGIFLVGAAPRPAGTRVHFELVLDGGVLALRGEGQVVWSETDVVGGGIAVRFTRLDGRSREFVEGLVAAGRVSPGSMPPAASVAGSPVIEHDAELPVDAATEGRVQGTVAMVERVEKELAALVSELGRPLPAWRRAARPLDVVLAELAALEQEVSLRVEDSRASRERIVASVGEVAPAFRAPRVAFRPVEGDALRTELAVATLPPDELVGGETQTELVLEAEVTSPSMVPPPLEAEPAVEVQLSAVPENLGLDLDLSELATGGASSVPPELRPSLPPASDAEMVVPIEDDDEYFDEAIEIDMQDIEDVRPSEVDPVKRSESPRPARASAVPPPLPSGIGVEAVPGFLRKLLGR